MSSRLSGMVMSANGEKLYFLSSFEKGYDLWELDVREKSTKILKKLGGGGAVLEINDKGDVYVYQAAIFRKLTPMASRNMLNMTLLWNSIERQNGNICSIISFAAK